MSRAHGSYVRYKLGPDANDQPGRGCRCYPCSYAQAQEWRRVSKLKVEGRWEPFTDAAPARAHVHALKAAGMGWKRIAAAAGVANGTMIKLLYGYPHIGRSATRRMRHTTAARILAVRLDVHDRTSIDATGTRRRAYALAALGWSLSYQARRLSRSVGAYCSSLKRPAVLAGRARAVAALYEELATATPPPGRSADRARRQARLVGWPPPLAWDDDTIDDPGAEPAGVLTSPNSDVADTIDEIAVARACAGQRVRLTQAELTAAVSQLRRQGLSAHQTAQRLHIATRTVQRYTARAAA